MDSAIAPSQINLDRKRLKIARTGHVPFDALDGGGARLVDCGECESSEAIDLLIHSGRTSDAIGIEGWRVDVGYSADRDRAAGLLRGEEPDTVEE